MSHAILNFDTLQCSKKFQKAGFTAEQAEIQAETFNEQAKAVNEIMDNNLATKSDLEALRLATKSDLEALRLATKADMEKLEYKLSYKLTIRVGAMLASTVIILGVLIPIISKIIIH